ncbi:hypothetical protein [Saccharopolyspora mangrovi]|uniref:Uncharacterized protein n=1 Tax=Saccharopolyspora mangrovi TaxID=3082379 RepID=A0ABU6A7E9_9PSEU|nr:hypothetical protein [Saccharopolyspora sp. S2-29]MEB3367383.1 hypothetical protein [Saccharopolyspora sp. S2-29]
MDEGIKNHWIEALESGRYRPGTGALRETRADGGDSFCCLGVLADLIKPEAWRGKCDDQLGSSLWRHGETDTFSGLGLLRQDIGESVGLDLVQQKRLAELNDAADPPSYEAVVSYIKEHL